MKTEHVSLPSQKIVSNEHITSQKIKFFEIINITFGEKTDRTLSLIEMYRELDERLSSAPASSRIYFHNAYKGGYLDHVLNVIDASLKVESIYREFGGAIDYTPQERVFAAMHHDLGKLGDEDGPFYLPDTNFKSNSSGVYFQKNSRGQVMSGYDRALYILQYYGISFSKNEMLGIKMADGLFSEEAKPLFTSSGIFPHKTSLGYIIHWADWISAKAEADEVRVEYQLNLIS